MTDKPSFKEIFGLDSRADAHLTRAQARKMQFEMGAIFLEMLPEVNDNFVHFFNRLNLDSFFPTDTPVEAVKSEAHNLHCWVLWARDGYNEFNLSESILAGFLLTEPPKQTEPLQLPYGSFAITIPPGYLKMDRGWADTIWVYKFRSLHAKTGTVVDFFRWSICGGDLHLWMDADPNNLEDTHLYDILLQRVWAEDPPVAENDTALLKAGIRIVRNLLSWLDASGGATKQPRAFRPVKKKRKEVAPGPVVWMIGHTVKLRPELKRMAAEIVLAGTDKAAAGWKVRVKHTVRGHWKMQAHGEGRADRRRLWVQPYWRGPDGAAAWSHLYEFKEEAK